VISTDKTGSLIETRMTVSRAALDADEMVSESLAQKADLELPRELLAVEAMLGRHRKASEARRRGRQRGYSSNG
jgi:hypothetical protein